MARLEHALGGLAAPSGHDAGRVVSPQASRHFEGIIAAVAPGMPPCGQTRDEVVARIQARALSGLLPPSSDTSEQRDQADSQQGDRARLGDNFALRGHRQLELPAPVRVEGERQRRHQQRSRRILS